MELSLLPCPFCGKPAEASHTMRATIEETMEAEPYINCSQPKCAGRHVCASVSEWQYRTDRIAELELFTRAAGTSLANANDRIAELEQQLAAAQERERWIPISDGLPENIRPVLVRARDKRGECFVLRAAYAHKRELEIDSDDYADGFADHDEDNDIDYCPDGWYESNYTDEVHYYLGHLEITHWRELPAPPAEKE